MATSSVTSASYAVSSVSASTATISSSAVRGVAYNIVEGQNTIEIYVDGISNALLKTLTVGMKLESILASGTTKIDGGKIFAGSSIQIGNLDGMSDYCSMTNGDISFYQFINGTHYLVKSLKNIDSGVAVSGEWSTLDGHWQKIPNIFATLNNLTVYDARYSAQSQSARVEIIDSVLNSDGTVQIYGQAILELAAGTHFEEIGTIETEKTTAYTNTSDILTTGVYEDVPPNTRKITATTSIKGKWCINSDGDANHYTALIRARLQYYANGAWRDGPWSSEYDCPYNSYATISLVTPQITADITLLRVQAMITGQGSTLLSTNGEWLHYWGARLDAAVFSLEGGIVITSGAYNYLAIA